MPDNWRFSEREIERELRDLGDRIEFPPTPDVSHTVRLRLDEEHAPQAGRTWRWPSFLSPRWTAAVATLVLISIFALSPTLRTTLSDLVVSGQQTGSEAAKPVAGPENGGSEDLARQEAGGASKAAGSSAAGGGEATGCPSPSIEALPARATAGEKFRLRGYGFSSGCDGAGIKPATGIRIYFRQDGRIWRLATLDADRNLTFVTNLRVPAGADPGRASVQADAGSEKLVKTPFVVLR